MIYQAREPVERLEIFLPRSEAETGTAIAKAEIGAALFGYTAASWSPACVWRPLLRL